MVDFYACLFCKVVDFCMLIFKSGWFLRNKLSILQLTFQTFGLLCAISQSCGLLPMIFLNGWLFKVIDFYTCFFLNVGLLRMIFKVMNFYPWDFFKMVDFYGCFFQSSGLLHGIFLQIDGPFVLIFQSGLLLRMIFQSYGISLMFFF